MPKPWLQPIERALLNAAQVAEGEEVPQELAHALLDLEQRVEVLVEAARKAQAFMAMPDRIEPRHRQELVAALAPFVQEI